MFGKATPPLSFSLQLAWDKMQICLQWVSPPSVHVGMGRCHDITQVPCCGMLYLYSNGLYVGEIAVTISSIVYLDFGLIMPITSQCVT